MAEIPNDIIPKIESVYTKENGWKTLVENVKQFAINKIQSDVSKNEYYGSVFIGSANEFSEFQGYKRIIRVSNIVGIPDFIIGKKKKIVLRTFWTIRNKIAKISSLNDDYETISGIFDNDKIDLSNKSDCDTYIQNIVKDKPDFYIRMLDQMRSTYSNKFSRETKRNMMAVIETAIEMGANGTTALLTAKEINPNTIPTTTDGTGTGTTGTGTGSAGSESSTSANVALIGLGLFAVGLLLSNTEKPKNN